MDSRRFVRHRPGPAPGGNDDLEGLLRALDRKPYPAYRDLAGPHRFPRFTLFVDHVQGDPFAAPSRLRARVDARLAGFPPDLFATRTRRVALEDFLARAFRDAVRTLVRGSRGTGKSGLVAIDAGGQEVLERTAVLVNDRFVEARFVVGLPAAGRTILAREAADLLLREVPAVVEAALFYASLDAAAARRHVETVEDAQALRASLAKRGLVAFVADGSILARESGVSQRPLDRRLAVPFASPPELRVELATPNRGRVRGMGVPAGVTLIVGGGFHGKSTLLLALQNGVYDHVPGDGRELVVTRADAVKIRAEDGRRIEAVDISPFIANLPFGRDTTCFRTDNASGSTSQAANIIEALEIGTSLLLIDEDTSATNFMIRDRRMQLLVAREREPITPFIDRARELWERFGVSTVLVTGGSGDYFDVADTVIRMDAYVPSVVTEEARRIAAELPGGRVVEVDRPLGPVPPRVPQPESLDPRRHERVKVRGRGLEQVQFGWERIDLSAVEQLVDPSQTNAIAAMLVHALRRGFLDGRRTLREALVAVYRDVEERGLDALSPHPPGHHPGELALPRIQEVAAATNRLRTLEARQIRP